MSNISIILPEQQYWCYDYYESHQYIYIYKQDFADLGELSELQNISLSSSTQNPLSFSGHILILLSDGLQLSANRPTVSIRQQDM